MEDPERIFQSQKESLIFMSRSEIREIFGDDVKDEDIEALIRVARRERAIFLRRIKQESDDIESSEASVHLATWFCRNMEDPDVQLLIAIGREIFWPKIPEMKKEILGLRFLLFVWPFKRKVYLEKISAIQAEIDRLTRLGNATKLGELCLSVDKRWRDQAEKEGIKTVHISLPWLDLQSQKDWIGRTGILDGG